MNLAAQSISNSHQQAHFVWPRYVFRMQVPPQVVTSDILAQGYAAFRPMRCSLRCARPSLISSPRPKAGFPNCTRRPIDGVGAEGAFDFLSDADILVRWTLGTLTTASRPCKTSSPTRETITSGRACT